jgi:hypothetical protein
MNQSSKTTLANARTFPPFAGLMRTSVTFILDPPLETGLLSSLPRLFAAEYRNTFALRPSHTPLAALPATDRHGKPTKAYTVTTSLPEVNL